MEACFGQHMEDLALGQLRIVMFTRNEKDIKEARYVDACHAFKTRLITTDVFMAVLYSLGYRGRAIRSEVNLNWPEKR